MYINVYIYIYMIHIYIYHIYIYNTSSLDPPYPKVISHCSILPRLSKWDVEAWTSTLSQSWSCTAREALREKAAMSSARPKVRAEATTPQKTTPDLDGLELTEFVKNHSKAMDFHGFGCWI